MQVGVQGGQRWSPDARFLDAWNPLPSSGTIVASSMRVSETWPWRLSRPHQDHGQASQTLHTSHNQFLLFTEPLRCHLLRTPPALSMPSTAPSSSGTLAASRSPQHPTVRHAGQQFFGLRGCLAAQPRRGVIRSAGRLVVQANELNKWWAPLLGGCD